MKYRIDMSEEPKEYHLMENYHADRWRVCGIYFRLKDAKIAMYECQFRECISE